MALLKRRTTTESAVRFQAQALSGFHAAYQDLAESTRLLGDAQTEHEQKIAELRNNLTEVVSHQERNERVRIKLADLLGLDE